jgi:hypothetical protein
MYSSWCSNCCWPSFYCGIPGVVGAPTVAFVPAFAGILAVASISANPGYPILAGFFYCTVLYCTLNTLQWDIHTGLSNWLPLSAIKLLEYRIRILESQNTTLYRLPTSDCILSLHSFFGWSCFCGFILW